MPRWRKLHVKTVESLDMNDMPDDFTRLLWVLLPLGLDREGRGLDNPAWVKSKTMPLRVDVGPRDIVRAIDWLGNRGMIVRYQVEGRAYFYVPTFHKYQGITAKEAESEYPAPPQEVESRSGVGQELGESRSSTDSDSDSDSDSDVDSEAESGDADAPPALDDLPFSDFEPEPEPELEPPPKKRRSRADPRTKHPAIQALRHLTGKLPPKVNYTALIAALGDDPDEDKMRRCLEAWTARGYNPRALTPFLEWYHAGVPSNGRASPANVGADIDAALRSFANGDP